jgi:hypothetical protein
MINDGKYVRVWEKYRPVLLSLMVASKKEPQTYLLSNHEFIDINPKKLSRYAFLMRFHMGKSMTDIKKSLLAPDLLFVLKRSARAMELSESAIYEIQMDKLFNITITHEEVEVEATEEDAEGEAATEEPVAEEATKEENEDATTEKVDESEVEK